MGLVTSKEGLMAEGNEKNAAQKQDEAAVGGTAAILDPGPGWPIVTGLPSEDAKRGTPLDPDGHVRLAEESGRTEEEVTAARAKAAEKPLIVGVTDGNGDPIPEDKGGLPKDELAAVQKAVAATGEDTADANAKATEVSEENAGLKTAEVRGPKESSKKK